MHSLRISWTCWSKRICSNNLKKMSARQCSSRLALFLFFFRVITIITNIFSLKSSMKHGHSINNNKSSKIHFVSWTLQVMWELNIYITRLNAKRNENLLIWDGVYLVVFDDFFMSRCWPSLDVSRNTIICGYIKVHEIVSFVIVVKP